MAKDVRVAYFPIKIEESNKAIENELIIDYINNNVFMKSEDGFSVDAYPSKDNINEMVEIAAGDIILNKPNPSGDTYQEIDSNMDIVLAWVKSFKGEGNNITMSRISALLAGYDEDDNILAEFDNKVDKDGNKVLVEANFDGYVKNILDSVQYGANAYAHPEKQQCEYVPPVSTINGYFDDVNLTIRDIEGLETVEDGANNFKHPQLPACYLENFGVVAVNGKSGNVTIGPLDVGLDKVQAYPITYINTPQEDIQFPSYASLQGAHNIIKNMYGHNDIVNKIRNQNKVQVTFITDNDVLIRDNTWYVELKDKRTEGALFNFTGRAFSLDVDTTYIWTLKSSRTDEVVSNKSGSLHVGFDDMLIEVGDGVRFIDRNVELFLDNSDNKWNNKTHLVRRFNIRRIERGRPLDTIVAIAQSSGGVFKCALPDGEYEAELIYFDEDMVYGDTKEEVQYQVDDFKVGFNGGNTIRVPIKNQHFIPPNLTNLYITINSFLVKKNGNSQDVTEDSMIYLRASNGDYFPHTNEEGRGTLYRADSLYNDAEKEIVGRVIYTDKQGHEYKAVEFTIKRNFSKSEYRHSVYTREIEYGESTLPFKMLLTNPLTYDDLNVELEIEDIKTGEKRIVKSTGDEIDNSKQHFNSSTIDKYSVIEFGDEKIKDETIYRATLFTGDTPITEKFVVTQTTFNQFDFTQVETRYLEMYKKGSLDNRRDIVNGVPPFIIRDGSDIHRYQDVRVFLKGSETAKKNAIIEVKRTQIDEATGVTSFGNWVDITEDRAVKIYANELWESGNVTLKPVQYTIRIRGEKVKPKEIVVDNISPNIFGQYVVHEMVAELYVPEPESKPDPGPDPEPQKIMGLQVQAMHSTYEGLRAAIRVKGAEKWLLGNPISDNSKQHYYELNDRNSVDRFVLFAFNYKTKPNDILDVALVTTINNNVEFIARYNEAIRINAIGYADIFTGHEDLKITSREEGKSNIEIWNNSLHGTPHASRYHDIRFVPTPPNANIEVNIDSKWEKVSGRAYRFRLNLAEVPVRVSAYGYLTSEYNLKLGGPAFSDGRLTVSQIPLEMAPMNKKIWLQIKYVNCAYPYDSKPLTITGAASIYYRIFDKGKWTERRNFDVFSVVGEGERLIEPVDIGGYKQCLENIVAYNINYLTSNKPTDPGYSEDNPLVIMIPLSGPNTKHSDHAIFRHSQS